MGKIDKSAFKLTSLCAALIAIHGPAIADEEEVRQLTTPESWVSFGIGNWSNDRPQQGIYDGMRDGKAYGLIDADIVRRDNATGTWLRFSTRDLGLDTRELRGEWLRQGNIGAFVEYSRIPRDNPFTFSTGLQGIGTNRLVTSGTGANALPFTLVDLGTHRDVTSLGFFKNLMPGLDFKVTFKNDDKEGTRQWGRGGAPEFAVEPIDSTIRQLEATLEYKTERLQLAGGYYGSWYQNDAGGYVDSSVNGGNQSFTTGTVTRYALSLPLDNKAHQAFFNGGYNFSPTTRGTVKLQYTHATQDELLPTQGIAGLSLRGSPQNLNGEIDTTLVQLGLTSRPLPDLSLLANLRYHDVREKTPQARFVQSSATLTPANNCATTVTCVDNTPLTFKTLSGKVEGNYRLPMQFSLIGAVDYKSQDRTVPVGLGSVDANGVDRQRYVPFRADLDETTYTVQLRRAMSETINGKLAFMHSKRDGSSYTLTNETQSDQINPIHISDRDRNKWRATLDWTPTDALSVQLNVEDAEDKYKPSSMRPYGLRNGDAALYSLDVSYALDDRLQLTAWYQYDRTKATQFSQRNANSGAAQAQKEADLEDNGNAVGIGLRGRVSDRLKVGTDLQYSKNTSKYPETVTLLGPGTVYPSAGGVSAVGPLPEIENKLTRLKLFANYVVQKNAELRFDFIHERWQTDDWSWLFANGATFTYGTTTDGTQVTQDSKQISNFIGVRYIYKFQ